MSRSVYTDRCETCFAWNKPSDLQPFATENEGRLSLCPKCRCLFYVLAVEPGAEERVRKAFTLETKLKGLWSKVKKILIPREFQSKITKDKYLAFHRWNKFGKTSKQVTFEDQYTGKKGPGYVYAETEQDALWEAKKKFGDHFDITHVELVQSGGRKVTQRRKAYTGYIIIQMEFNDDLRLLIDKLKAKGAWGLLPMKPTFTKKIPGGGTRPRPPKELRPKLRPDPKSDWGFAFVRDRKTGEIAMTKHQEMIAVESWHPTPVTSEEAAYLLVHEASLKGEAPAMKVPFAVGDQVRAIEGAWKGIEGVVLEIGGEPTDPEAKVQLTILNRPVNHVIKCESLSKI